MDIRSRYMNQECFYHYRKVIKNIVRNLYYLQLQKKKKNQNYNELRHEPAQNPHNIGYFNKFLENDDLEEHTFILLHFGEVRSPKSVSLSVNQGISNTALPPQVLVEDTFLEYSRSCGCWRSLTCRASFQISPYRVTATFSS